ncbi:MAG TPA: family 20 glycosylhydrolase, partial [Flavitalea sp.]|nr:family 20 glycosylhydrolase [Flavitalea sp.]
MNKKNKWLIIIFLHCIYSPVEINAAVSQSGVPDLIPLPQSVHWFADEFDLSKCKSILINTDSIKTEADHLHRQLRNLSLLPVIPRSFSMKPNTIFLELGKVKAERNAEEAYQLKVNVDGIIIRANTTKGIFYGIQTLLQLITDKGLVKGCEITDYPAFQWRGYMVDVGRNYQSPAQLKQQIDMMARYKLNIFHFHLTEDVAWRLQVGKYPQLTAP